jgi:hypothetical protein
VTEPVAAKLDLLAQTLGMRPSRLVAVIDELETRGLVPVLISELFECLLRRIVSGPIRFGACRHLEPRNAETSGTKQIPGHGIRKNTCA